MILRPVLKEGEEMQGKKKVSLGTARWIALLMYVSGLVIYPIVGALAAPSSKGDKLLPYGSLPLILLGVSVMSYIISLVLEHALLARARKRKSELEAVNAAIVNGAFGESFAIFGLVLTFIGLGNWAVLFYGLCFVHGLHLLVRWPSYESAVSRESYETD